MLKIFVLGPPAIYNDDQPLDIQRRQLRTLLYFLACQPEGAGRGELFTRFWPEAKESDARRQLREILSKLRTQLPDPGDLQTDHDRVWINRQSVYSDVQNFLSLVQPVQDLFDSSHGKIVLSVSMVEMLEKAVSLWRSPSFLAGGRISNTQAFDDWIQEKASSLEFYRLQSLEQLADHYSAIGQLDKAILYVNKALESDTLNEALQAQLLSLLYGAGRVSEAQTYYSYLMELYQRELSDNPPETLINAMVEVGGIPIEGKKHQPVINNWRKNVNQVFVGRTKELENLERNYKKGGVVLITGEIGSGKTRLVNHFYSSIKDKPKLMYCACHSSDTDLPFQPFINLIHDYITREDWENLDQRWLKTLSILVPDMIRKSSSVQHVNDWSSREVRMELFEAIHQLFISACRNKKMLLVMDDIHWSDVDSLDALIYLTRQGFFNTLGFVILISRIEINNPKIWNLLISDKNQEFIPRISLESLTKQETAELSRFVLGQDPYEGFIDNLQKATGGNPSFIIETLNVLLDSSSNAYIIQQDDIPLTENLSAIILEKEMNLSEPAREVLSAAAMCGMEFHYDILERMHFCEPDLLVNSLEELEEKSYIQPNNSTSSVGQYSFIHSLIRDSVLSRLSNARQCLWHEQIAKALLFAKGSLNNRQASNIAQHFEAAGKPLQAFQYWVRSGKYARGLFSVNGAYSAYEKANRIQLDFGQSIPRDSLYDLFFEWGDLAYNVMDVPAMEDCYSAMYEAGEQTGDFLLTGAGLSGMALSATFCMEIDKALVLLQQSISILEKTDNLYEKIQARSRMGTALSMGMQNEKAIEFYQQAIELGKAFPSQNIRQAVTNVQYQIACLYCFMGWPEKAKITGKQGLLNAYLLISMPAVQSNVHMALAMAAYYSGNFEEANEHIRYCLKVNESIQNLRTTTLVLLIQARIHCHTGRLDSAWDQVNNSLKISMENGYFENIAEAHCILGDIFLILQNFPEAIREFSLGCEKLLESYQGMNCYYRLGYAYAMNGEMEKGLDILEKAITFLRQAGYMSLCLPALLLKGKIYCETGRFSDAQPIMDEVVKEVEQRGLSLQIFPESIQQAFLICESTDNAQAEIILSNLFQKPGIQPGPWL